jgi:hypothetical protein
MTESMVTQQDIDKVADKVRRRSAYLEIREGRKAFRGYPPERASGKQARRTMLGVFQAKGFFVFASVLRGLIRNPRLDTEGKAARFRDLLDKYAKAVSA